MLEILNEEEKEVAMMLIQGQNCRVICEWLGLDYDEYYRIKRSIFRKLKIKRVTQILPLAIKHSFI